MSKLDLEATGAVVLPKRVALWGAIALVAAAVWSASEMHFANRANATAIDRLETRATKTEARLDELARDRQALTTDIARLQVELRNLGDLMREVRELVRQAPR